MHNLTLKETYVCLHVKVIHDTLHLEFLAACIFHRYMYLAWISEILISWIYKKLHVFRLPEIFVGSA